MNDKEIELIRESMHELRVFNDRLLTSTQKLGQSLKTHRLGEGEPLNCNSVHADDIRTSVMNVQHLTKLSMIRMSFIDYELNPDFFSESEPYPVNIYGKFLANKIALNATSKKHKVKIKLDKSPDNIKLINAVTLIDILPFLILDNAIKYSPNECDVNVHFTAYLDEIEVKVVSTGPYVPHKELKRLVTKGYRGSNAKALTNIKGQGIGLYFADSIAKLHDARMELSSSESTYCLNGISYSDFTVTLRLPVTEV
ncbi:sensor histidine kinase [Vibrio sp. 10N.261.46.A3]|uniref:sensor histidine kinase n=1 Tax=Vibrio sp. 10N.261.46.A3 TaxID=3229658 RepID=UPI00354B60D2